MMRKCRVCGHALFDEPLLRYGNMPKAAQFLPDEGALGSEAGVDLEVCQCGGCGLVQLGNDPVPYYREVIRAAAFSEEMKAFRIRQFGSFVRNYSLQGKKTVEIGCGRGEYLHLMRQAGAAAYGLEAAADSVAACVSDGLKVQKGFIESSACRLDNAPFDAFFILNFLEHLPDLNSVLSGICNNLTDTAIGLVETPNFDMILRNRLFSEFIGDHLYYFTRETLTAILQRNGFEIINCQEIWHNYILSVIVKKRGRMDLSHFTGYQAKLKNELEEYIGRFGDKQVAIWGAGHQALTLMSLLNLAGKIRYVVDSAPFKQGRYTPATHLPIVPPDTLDSEPVDAVIIMAASYSDEVARILRRKFTGTMNVSIVRDFGLEIVHEDCRKGAS
jgi:2-polyprenyl-3-methyl-5-hydroxy-6-metoxy-1,4-benzoquinol methylase